MELGMNKILNEILEKSTKYMFNLHYTTIYLQDYRAVFLLKIIFTHTM
jgi:hypothetical protein